MAPRPPSKLQVKKVIRMLLKKYLKGYFNDSSEEELIKRWEEDLFDKLKAFNYWDLVIVRVMSSVLEIPPGFVIMPQKFNMDYYFCGRCSDDIIAIVITRRINKDETIEDYISDNLFQIDAYNDSPYYHMDTLVETYSQSLVREKSEWMVVA